MRGQSGFDPFHLGPRAQGFDDDFEVTPMPADWPSARRAPSRVLLLAEVGPAWLDPRYCSMVIVPIDDPGAHQS